MVPRLGPLFLAASVLVFLSNTVSALPAQNPSNDSLEAGDIPPVLPPNAYKRQEPDDTELNTPAPVIFAETTEAGTLVPAEPVETPTATVPFEEPVAAEDPNDWRNVNCESEGLRDHTLYGPDRWKEVDANDAWNAVIDGWKANLTAGREQKHFSNNGSIDSYHSETMAYVYRCPTTSTAPKTCSVKPLATRAVGVKVYTHLQCHSASAPAGYFILHSFENMHSNIWSAVGDAVRDNDIGSIADEFGKVPVKEGGLATSILIDIALTCWGLVMGPAWNKLIGPKFSDSTNAGTLKDTTNDIVKNSLGLTKDILNSRAKDQLGVQNGLAAQMQALTEGWKVSVLETQKWLFGGSEEGYTQLGNMISDASMFGDGWLLDRADHVKQVKRAINSFLIPLAWQYSPDVIYPFVAESDVGCEDDPGWNKEASFTTMAQHWIDDGALKDRRFCHEGKSYWLLGGRDRNKNCDSKSGESDCGGFELPPGFQSLVDKKFTDITLGNVVVGFINSKNANGGENGFKLDMNDPSRETLESLAGTGIEAPGIFNIPICSMDEVIENYYQWYGNDHEDMTNFPCNP
ncbi:hypothetical protein ACHAPT_006249 [Fusarium lateritium]